MPHDNQNSNEPPVHQSVPGKKKRIFLVSLFAMSLVLIGGIGALAFRANGIINNITGEEKNLISNIHSLASAQESLQQENGRTNILLLGIRGKNDPNGGLLADSIHIVSIHHKKEEVALISVPRDLLVKEDSGEQYKLNAANTKGENYQVLSGLRHTQKIMSDITDMEIHYGATINFEGFKEIIDILGGITVNVGQDFYDPNYEGGINVSKGPTYMDSEKAHRYVWARMTTDDFDRSRRQREVINAVKTKAQEQGLLRDPQFLMRTLNTLEDDLKTTMPVKDMRAAMKELSTIDLQNIEEVAYTVDPEGPFTDTISDQFGYIIVPRENDWTLFQEDIQSVFQDEPKLPQSQSESQLQEPQKSQPSDMSQ